MFPFEKGSSEFDLLSPKVVLKGIEYNHNIELTEQMMPYPSYVNRVYGVKSQEGTDYIAKFYRPGRWTFEGIEDEHAFLADCDEAEIPLAVPIADEYGETIGEVAAVGPDGEETVYYFALFPKKGGRQFDAEGDDEWLRMGSLLGRLHQVGMKRPALNRPVCSPDKTTRLFVEELLVSGLVPSEVEAEFEIVTSKVINEIIPLFREDSFIRIHGDCHRGNILDRQKEGLLLIDFDDMMTGPAVQDMWLLLPDYAEDSRRELFLLLEGYEEFLPFNYGQMKLLEPLRFMRIVHYILWCARQRHDSTFLKHFPDWGSRTYWIKEVEDLKLEADRVFRWISRDEGMPL
ncbi:MAG: serine/threonine protein kinase [Spirochaetales bacterium]|nr:serine/threonine protein kinase [Spirochaetales bacterium]